MSLWLLDYLQTMPFAICLLLFPDVRLQFVDSLLLLKLAPRTKPIMLLTVLELQTVEVLFPRILMCVTVVTGTEPTLPQITCWLPSSASAWELLRLWSDIAVVLLLLLPPMDGPAVVFETVGTLRRKLLTAVVLACLTVRRLTMKIGEVALTLICWTWSLAMMMALSAADLLCGGARVWLRLGKVAVSVRLVTSVHPIAVVSPPWCTTTGGDFSVRPCRIGCWVFGCFGVCDRLGLVLVRPNVLPIPRLVLPMPW